MHLSDEVVRLEHLTHGIGKRERNRHWQPLRNCHHHERDRDHDGFEGIGNQMGDILIYRQIMTEQNDTDINGKKYYYANETEQLTELWKHLDYKPEENC